MNKVELIEQSVACQRFGARSLVPLFGIGAGIQAFRSYRRVRGGVGDMWNPARPQLIRGIIFARVGILINFVVVAALALHFWAESFASYAARLINPLLDWLF